MNSQTHFLPIFLDLKNRPVLVVGAGKVGLRKTKELVEAGIADQSALNAIWDKVKEDMVRNLKLSIDDSVSPHIPLETTDPDYIAKLMFSNGTVRAFEAGVIDVPFAPSRYNAGKIMPARDNEGAVRLLGTGMLPLTEQLKKFHQDKIATRGVHENRGVSFQMVIDDIYAISKGRLVGRPR